MFTPDRLIDKTAKVCLYGPYLHRVFEFAPDSDEHSLREQKVHYAQSKSAKETKQYGTGVSTSGFMEICPLLCSDDPVVGGSDSLEGCVVYDKFDHCGPVTTARTMSCGAARRPQTQKYLCIHSSDQEFNQNHRYAVPYLSRYVYYSVWTLLLEGRHAVEGATLVPYSNHLVCLRDLKVTQIKHVVCRKQKCCPNKPTCIACPILRR